MRYGWWLLSSLARFSHKLSLYLECLAVLLILLPTWGASRGIIQCSFMSPIQNEPQSLAETSLSLWRLFKKVNGVVQKVYNKKAWQKRPATLAPPPVPVSFLLSFKFSCHWLDLPGYWTLLPTSLPHHYSTPLASLQKRKASTKCPLLILWSRSILHQSFRFSSLLITFNLTHKFSSCSGDGKSHLALFKNDI